MSTPSMRVCQVDEHEDLVVFVTEDLNIATLDVEVVACGELSDARVRVTTDSTQAVEYVNVVAGAFV